MILTVSSFDEVFPFLTDAVNLFLVLLVHFVVVHLEDAELLLGLTDLEFHVHRDVLDLSDFVE